MKSFIKKFHYGQKGFTLIELLVVVAILGVLAAVAVPNVGKFIGQGKAEAAATELHNVQTAVMAGMADGSTGSVIGGCPVDAFTENFGDTDQDQGTAGVDLTVSNGPDGVPATADDITVGAFIVGGADKVTGSYSIDVEGTVNQEQYPL